MNKFFYIFFFLVASVVQQSIGQNKKIDSLWSVYNNKSLEDSARLNALHFIAWSYRGNKPDTAIILAEQELKLANTLSINKAKIWAARAFNTIGVSYKNKSNYPKALEYDLKALKLFEEIGNKKGIGDCYTNIGLIYFYQSNYLKALEYDFKALKTLTEIANKPGMSACYMNMGSVFIKQANYSKAIEYYFKALPLKEEIKDRQGISACYNNIGETYSLQSDYPKALEYFLKALQVKKAIKDKSGIGICYGNLGNLYISLLDYKKVMQYSDSCLQVSKEIGDIEGEREAYHNLATAYGKTGKYKEAYENHVKFKQLTDSIFNADNSKQLGDLKTQFEVEKKEAELKIKSDAEQEKLLAIASEEKKRQQVIIASVAGVLLVVVIFSLFLYKRFRITQRQKTIIEKQKIMVDHAYEELHEKNKEVMDSIRYAKRIQTALITSEKNIENSLNRLMKKGL